MINKLFYGDNLEVLRNSIADETVDLCYIDPPFNSQRNYNQIYNALGKENQARSPAFIDTWLWDDYADRGLLEIQTNHQNRFTNQIIDLLAGLTKVLGKGSLLAYLVSLTLRIVEIHRVLKPTGSFYLHCDPSASHYLKIILDALFCPQGGEFQNEIIWCYKDPSGKTTKFFRRKHDVILFYSKSPDYNFYSDAIRVDYGAKTQQQIASKTTSFGRVATGHPLGKIPEDWWEIPSINSQAKERLGYPTQKPEILLERIIKASSKAGDVVLDAYGGGGTTVAVCQKLNRRWISIDITFQSISLTLKRLESTFSKEILATIKILGVPQDITSAKALAKNEDPRINQEFEKWAILTYSKHQAIINQGKSTNQSLDGIAYLAGSQSDRPKVILQVESKNIDATNILYLQNAMTREAAELGVLITLELPTVEAIAQAKLAGFYQSKQFTDKPIDKIQIVTIQEILAEQKRVVPNR